MLRKVNGFVGGRMAEWFRALDFNAVTGFKSRSGLVPGSTPRSSL